MKTLSGPWTTRRSAAGRIGRCWKGTAALLKQLHDEGRDHIWAYYTRNLVRPVALRSDKVDVIVGNPPWITYNRSEAVVREELERQSKGRYKIWAGGRYATQQDVAGLFFARCAELYLDTGGTAAMVLPHSALQTGQYRKWRSGDWGIVFVDLSVRPPWDLERIEPNDFFPVPACVAFLRKRIEVVGKPLSSHADRWRGPVGGPFARETVALADTSGGFASPYGERAKNGATIYPRPLFFVNVEEATALVQAANTIVVSPRRSKQEKTPWRELGLSELSNQSIEAEHVFDVLLGETVAPYILLEPLKAVLPLSKTTRDLDKADGGWYGVAPSSLGYRMRRRWRVINELWETNTGRSNKLTLLENLDYISKLSIQQIGEASETIRLVYSASGHPTAAVLSNVDRQIDHSLFWIDCRSADEARYMTAVINSFALEKRLTPLMPKGQFGARHVHKHLWRLPVPEYNDSDPLHVELAEAGEAAAIGAKALWDGVRVEREGKGQSTSVTVARREIRKWLSESADGRRVEELVGSVVGGLEVAVGGFVAAEHIGDGDDFLLIVNYVEDSPVPNRSAVEIAAQHQHFWRSWVLLEDVELLVDASPLSASESGATVDGRADRPQAERARLRPPLVARFFGCPVGDYFFVGNRLQISALVAFQCLVRDGQVLGFLFAGVLVEPFQESARRQRLTTATAMVTASCASSRVFSRYSALPWRTWVRQSSSNIAANASTVSWPRKRVSHLSGLSRKAPMILPSVGVGCLGMTMCARTLSIAFTALSKASTGLGSSRLHAAVHASRRCDAVASSGSTAVRRLSSSSRDRRLRRVLASSSTVQADPPSERTCASFAREPGGRFASLTSQWATSSIMSGLACTNELSHPEGEP